MTNHVHLVVKSQGDYKLSDVIRDFKKYTSKKIIDQIENEPESRREWMLNLFKYSGKGSSRHKNYKFWQSGNHAIELYSPRFLWDKVMYIHNNPVEAGFVSLPEDWLYSSAGNYVGSERLVINEIECLSPPLRTVE